VLALARDGQITRFSPRALALITVLLAANGTVVDYADLIAALYGDSADGGPEYIMECLYKQKRSLAAKCGEIGIVIHSWYGVGMWLEAAGSAHAEMAA
jgi:DNA-binding response OmpR family regulator